MVYHKLTKFFLWNTIINFCLLILTVILIKTSGDWIYETQSKFFLISRDKYDYLMFIFVGLYKLAIIIFNLIPFISMAIIQGREK